MDEHGYPYLKEPQKCISCGMCEKLCPDFAISLIEEVSADVSEGMPEPGTARLKSTSRQSPERIAPSSEETGHEKEE